MSENRNPIDGYRDIYEWPHHWDGNLSNRVNNRIAVLQFAYEDLDPWTYNNHWQVLMGGQALPDDSVVDLYWKDDNIQRGQMPKAYGDIIADILITESGHVIRHLLWWHRLWTPAGGWEPWGGVQGDFVDHIHVEFWNEGNPLAPESANGS